MTQILIHKPVSLGSSILGLSKSVMYEICYDYVKSKYGVKAKLCYIGYRQFHCSRNNT